MTYKKKKKIRRKIAAAVMLTVMLVAGLINHLFIHYDANAGTKSAISTEYTVSCEIVYFLCDKPGRRTDEFTRPDICRATDIEPPGEMPFRIG